MAAISAAQETPTLCVHTSNVPGAGLGLFTLHAIPAGTEVTQYRGTILSTKEAVRKDRDKSYLMRLGPQKYLDGAQDKLMLARYINDSCSITYNNVYFDKRPDEGVAGIVTLRDISAGEELLVSYGKWYWMKAPGSKLVAPDDSAAIWPPCIAKQQLLDSHAAVVLAAQQAASS